MRYASIAAVLMLAAAPAWAQGPDTTSIESYTIPSATPADFGELTVAHRAAAKPVNVPVQIYMPKHGSAPWPAMVVKHGSGGYKYEGPNLVAWAERLNSWGIAALVVDSFDPRGLSETVSDQGKLSEAADIADAYAGLKALAADPRIDRQRIGIIGFSRGGMVAAHTALETLRQGQIDGDLHFALHVPFYAYCNIEQVGAATDRAPMLFLHGEADDFVPAAPCRAYANWFESKGSAVQLITYPGAYHGFDRTKSGVDYIAGAATFPTCKGVFDVDQNRFISLGDVQNPPQTPDKVRNYFYSCLSWGAHVGQDEKARQDAFVRVHEFLTAHFRMTDTASR